VSRPPKLTESSVIHGLHITYHSLFDKHECRLVTTMQPDDICRVHGEDWCKSLPGAVATDCICRRLDAYAERAGHILKEMKLTWDKYGVRQNEVARMLRKLNADMRGWRDCFVSGRVMALADKT
jgi:hypothetical protein